MNDPARVHSETLRRDAVDASDRLRLMVEQHFDLVWRLVRRMGVPADRADDAAQEVFLVAANRIDDVRFGSERSFLFGTALRIARSTRRALGREVAVDLDEEASDLPQLDELTDQKRARDLLDRILERMDESLRAVFLLHEIEGLTAKEISEVVDAPLGTVASRLRRAREEFDAHVRRIEARNAGGLPARQEAKRS